MKTGICQSVDLGKKSRQFLKTSNLPINLGFFRPCRLRIFLGDFGKSNTQFHFSLLKNYSSFKNLAAKSVRRKNSLKFFEYWMKFDACLSLRGQQGCRQDVVSRGDFRLVGLLGASGGEFPRKRIFDNLQWISHYFLLFPKILKAVR